MSHLILGPRSQDGESIPELSTKLFTSPPLCTIPNKRLLLRSKLHDEDTFVELVLIGSQRFSEASFRLHFRAKSRIHFFAPNCTWSDFFASYFSVQPSEMNRKSFTNSYENEYDHRQGGEIFQCTKTQVQRVVSTSYT